MGRPFAVICSTAISKIPSLPWLIFHIDIPWVWLSLSRYDIQWHFPWKTGRRWQAIHFGCRLHKTQCLHAINPIGGNGGSFTKHKTMDAKRRCSRIPPAVHFGKAVVVPVETPRDFHLNIAKHTHYILEMSSARLVNGDAKRRKTPTLCTQYTLPQPVTVRHLPFQHRQCQTETKYTKTTIKWILIGLTSLAGPLLAS